jgi:hypothetical protein
LVGALRVAKKSLVSEKVERLIAADKLDAAGREIGREIQARITANRAAKQPPKRGNRRSGGYWRKSDDWYPTSPQAFLRGGGMRRLEYIAGARARDNAIHAEREHWLPRLERWHADAEGTRLHGFFGQEIRRLRRCLGVRPEPEHVREQIRERVRRFRERQR